LPVKINILWLIDRAGFSLVKKPIDLRLIRELPLIVGIWLKFLLRLICGHKLHIFGQSSGDPIIPNDL